MAEKKEEQQRTDDAYNKLRNDLGTDFKSEKVQIKELYSFRCNQCGYHNIHNVKELECGCGNKLEGTIVYRKIDGTVVYDARDKSIRKRKR